MKKLSILCGILLLLGFSSAPAYAQSFSFDLNGDDVPGDTKISIYEYDTIEVGVYLTGYTPTTNLFGVDWYFTWHTDSLDYVSNGGNDGQWDDVTSYVNSQIFTTQYKESPGIEGTTIHLLDIVMHCKTAPSTDFIKASLGTDGVVADIEGGAYTDVDDADGTIHQLPATTTTTTSTESTTTSPITISSTTSTSSTTTINTTTVPTTITLSSSTTTTIDDKPWWCPFEEIYGEDSEETELLRYFRDDILGKTPEGQEIIRLCYEWSPAIVKAMGEDEEFKKELKAIIDEILPLIRAEVR